MLTQSNYFGNCCNTFAICRYQIGISYNSFLLNGNECGSYCFLLINLVEYDNLLNYNSQEVFNDNEINR